MSVRESPVWREGDLLVLLEDYARSSTKALVIGVGGGADTCLARPMAELLKAANGVDLALAMDGPTNERHREKYGLVPCGEFGRVERFDGPPLRNDAPATRERGVAILASLAWDKGERLALAVGEVGADPVLTREISAAGYDLVVAVDGGGDVLAPSAAEERDGRTLACLAKWALEVPSSRRLVLLVAGPGADGQTPQVELGRRLTEGPRSDYDGLISRGWWRLGEPHRVDGTLVSAFEASSREARIWCDDWAEWHPGSARKVHVPQILTLAARGQLPPTSSSSTEVAVPRKSTPACERVATGAQAGWLQARADWLGQIHGYILIP